MSQKIPIVKSLFANTVTITHAIANPVSIEDIERDARTGRLKSAYEILPAEGRMFFDYDLDCPDGAPETLEIYQAIDKLTNILHNDFKIPKKDIHIAGRHGFKPNGCYKVSLRPYITNHTCNYEELEAAVKYYNTIHKDFPLDASVYTEEHKIGLLGCCKGYTKKNSNDYDTRVLKEVKSFKATWAQTFLGCPDPDSVVWKNPFPAVPKKPKKTTETSCEAEEIIEASGKYTNIEFDGNFFSCDEIGGECPNCGKTHDNNRYVYWTDGHDVWTRNLSNEENGGQGCKAKKIGDIILPCLFDENIAPPTPPATDKTPYEAMKEDFETKRKVCMIEKPVPMYIIDDENFVKRKELLETFQDYMIPGDQAELFVPKWLKDPEKRKKTRMDFLPGYCPEDTYNLWRGYEVADMKPLEEDVLAKDIEPFLRIVRAIAPSKPDYLLKWLANLFQHPDKKTKVAIVITGDQGIGKNSLFEFIGAMMGNGLYRETSDPEKEVFGTFTTFFERTKLAVFNEANCYKFHDKLKAFITDPTTRVERKGIQGGTIRNEAQVAVLSNNKVPVKVEDKERRFAVFNGTDELANNPDFWDNWFNVWSLDPLNHRRVYEYLMAQDVENYDWKKERPEDEAYLAMRLASLPIETKFIIHFITEAFPAHTNKIKGTDLFEIFKCYYPRYQAVDMDMNKFGMRLKSALTRGDAFSMGDEPMKAFHKTTQPVVWEIDRQKAFRWIKDSNYTTYEECPTTTTDYCYGPNDEGHMGTLWNYRAIQGTF